MDYYPFETPECPNCESTDWDFTNNDEARCVCGYRWRQKVEEDGQNPED